ncbi:MAG: AI-2E family transporter [Crocinitomicaceae bacterium]|nr:AI-2E family transporter [Crocinitomicaceae bacterium]
MEVKKHHPVFNALLLALVLYGLFVGKHLLIPLVMAIVVWYLINAIGAQIGRIEISGKHFPKWLRTTLAVLVVFSFFWFVGRLVIANLEEFEEVAPEYNERIRFLSAEISQRFDVPTFEEISREVDLRKIAGGLLNSSFGFLSALLVVIFYVVFLMLEQNIFGKKLDLIFTHRKNKVQFFQIMNRIDHSMKTYLSVKTLMSLLVAVCTYIIIISFGVDFAILWAFFTFLLNYIPFVGSFIAILLPSLLSLLQFGDPVISLVIFLILNGVQVIVGNYLEPRLVGKSLNLSPLVVVLSLAFWGSLWGIAGMFLCVPITVAVMIILSQFPSTRTAAILLSAGNDPAARVKKSSSDDSKSQ